MLSIFKSTKIDETFKNIVATIYTISNLLVNLCVDFGLIYCLKAIIHNYAIGWSFSDSGLVNDRHHLLLLLMTRYCSIIVISASIDVFTTICRLFDIFIAHDDYFQHQEESWTILTGVFEFINIITYVVAIYFSFSIGSYLYERYCFWCHNTIYGAAQKTYRRQHSSRSDNVGYVMMADHMDHSLTNSVINNNVNDLRPSHSHSHGMYVDDIDSTSSNRRITDFFDDNRYVDKI
eukprot:UN01754